MSSFLENSKIKVTPEQMVSKASQVKTKIAAIRQKIAELEKSVQGTQSYWNGEASNVYRNKYKTYKDSTDEIIKRLEEHVKDLNAMAGVYEATENEVKSVIEELPIDVIV